ncbi:MAG: zinc ribbon domain-containing protein [candidate division KSB1 bacterium]|nr:zinc ribbon domain-containing protein [candidate division KSB1 bacterium]MDZ7273800.1 zinc ribbon domain-containing protein [candidate division KSB1 bacterium]MDZ7285956.1 zinc ribbon domain-containing protein [candidate division KSB1 bacterium]MDZ7298988.1 zinc ribbon domain-containing protein [candidate division KSB1 bacterium]MDZ7309212.1 zinc ribbon domain-containing protein [candidate division KSB1 bacterium]
MPIYEYRCQNCETRFEQLIRDGEALILRCPHCGAQEVNRLLSVFATGASTGAAGATAAPADLPSGGHCCGGTCGCH